MAAISEDRNKVHFGTSAAVVELRVLSVDGSSQGRNESKIYIT